MSSFISFYLSNIQAAPGPLSQAEEEQKAIKEAEARTEVNLVITYPSCVFYQVSVDSKHNTLSGLAFPLQPEATDAIREYSQGTKDYVQLAIGEESCCNPTNCLKSNFLWNFLSSDLTKETVQVIDSGTCSLDQLPGKVPDDVGR